jgi:sulfide:quinone oxidoreductase
VARTIILGAGFSGQYAALVLSRALKSKGDHRITVVNPYPKFTYVPSMIWVSTGQLQPEKAQFDLMPVYDRLGIEFVQGLATEIHPDENYLLVEPRRGNGGEPAPLRLDYDYLINATGPHLDFEATEGLGPENGHTHSICTPPHAVDTARHYQELVERLGKGDRATVVIGTGHGGCTCQGAAFEFISLVQNDLVDRGLRDRVTLRWVSNEPRLGDFGISGFEVMRGPVLFTSEDMAKALFRDYGIQYDIRSHVHRVEADRIFTENANGECKEIKYDFAMLIPPFRGKPIRYLNSTGEDLSALLLNPGRFLKVDGTYGKAHKDITAADWPRTYQNQIYKNLFAVGIAFAPPGCASEPCVSKSGIPISAAIPRTGFTSELTGKAAALNIANLIRGAPPCYTASLAETAGMCIASLKNSWTKGSAAVIGIHPIVRNRGDYPEYGRDMAASTMEMGLAGAWLKKGLHHAFLYKLSAKPFWQHIP